MFVLPASAPFHRPVRASTKQILHLTACSNFRNHFCRTHGISEATFYQWRTKYAGLEVSDVKKLRQLEGENRRLKQMVAEQALDIQALKAVTAKNW